MVGWSAGSWLVGGPAARRRGSRQASGQAGKLELAGRLEEWVHKWVLANRVLMLRDIATWLRLGDSTLCGCTQVERLVGLGRGWCCSVRLVVLVLARRFVLVASCAGPLGRGQKGACLRAGFRALK